MKKSFTLFSVSALFLMLLFPVSVKADPIVLNFGYQDNQWTQNSEVAQPAECCAGYIAASDKIVTGSDFYYSGKQGDAVERDGDNWTGFNGSSGTITACTRSTVSLSAATYTFSLLTKDKGEMDITLPKISIDGTNYVGPQKVLVNSVEQSFSNNQYRYTANVETVLEYSITIASEDSYIISVQFTSGWRDKFKASTLTITQNAPATPTYAVSVDATNGTVTGDGTFEAGASVTLTASPDPDYSFSGWSTSDVDISGHENDNPLTFTMPGHAVSITANFTECTKHTVTLADDGNGSVSGGGLQCDGSVTVTATPNTGYRFVNWTNTSTSAVVSTDAEYTFTLSADISLTANFEVNPCTNTKTIQCETDRIIPTTGTSAPNKLEIITSSHHYSGYHGDGYCDFKGSDGELYYLFSAPSSTYNFTVYLTNVDHAYMNIYTTNSAEKCDETTITYGGTTYYKKSYHALDGPTGDNPIGYRTVSSVSLNGTYIIGLYGKSWTVYDQVVIEASTDVFCQNTITMQKSGDASADDPTSTPSNTAMAGTEVTITAGEASANHYFSGWTVLPENAVTFNDPASPTTTFVMPAEDVTITANYGAIVSSEFTYTTSGSGSITCATKSGSNVNSGTTIEMTAVPSDDYVFTGWTATAGTFSDEAALTTTFTMPSTAAEVTATFAQVDNVITVGSESGSSANNAGGGASITESNISDFDVFAHNVIKLAYSNMSGSDNWYGWNLGRRDSYNPANSAGATGFGFYYKTETDADKVAFCFDYGSQYKVELPATNNVWKYHYFDQSAANNWNGSNIIIYINGTDGGNTTANANGAIYLADIAATSITSKPEINTYTYTRENASNSYGTLCLPMDGSVSGATLYSVAGKQEEGGKLYIVLEEQGATLEAGEPYIFETNGETLTATMSGPHSDVKADANGLVGTYQRITAPVYNGSDDLNYVLALDNSNNTVFKKVGEDVTVGAYRAYLNIHNASDYSPASAAPGRKYIRFGIEGTEEAQAVEMIYDDASLRTRKIMQNGHLYILRDGHLFTAQGTQIK